MSRTKQKWCSFAIAILLPFSQKRKRQEKEIAIKIEEVKKMALMETHYYSFSFRKQHYIKCICSNAGKQ